MKEEIATFGRDCEMVGIVSRPPGATEPDKRPAILLLNVGILHRIGPFRLSVDLARKCADAGFLTMRFDLSGLGDSTVRHGSSQTRPPVQADVGEAMDFISARWGIQRFILWGLCTGAVNAHNTALVDERVCGLICLDGYAYPTARFTLNRYLPFLLSPLKLWKFLRWRVTKSIAPNTLSDTDEMQDTFGWVLPPKSTVARELQALIERDVRLLYIFSGDSQTRRSYNYQGQFRDMFPSLSMGELLEEAYI